MITRMSFMTATIRKWKLSVLNMELFGKRQTITWQGKVAALALRISHIQQRHLLLQRGRFTVINMIIHQNRREKPLALAMGRKAPFQ